MIQQHIQLTNNSISSRVTQRSKKHGIVNIPEITGNTNHDETSNSGKATEKQGVDPTNRCCYDATSQGPKNVSDDRKSTCSRKIGVVILSKMLVFYCFLLIHDASSNVAEIPSDPCTTEYISVDDNPVRVPDTKEDSEATIAQRT